LELSLGMAREVNLHALGQQAFTTALTTAGKDGATIFGCHAGAEPELLFTGAFGRLVGAFHKSLNSFGKRAETLPAPPPMSTGSWGDFTLIPNMSDKGKAAREVKLRRSRPLPGSTGVLACWFRRPAETHFGFRDRRRFCKSGAFSVNDAGSSPRRGRLSQHAGRVCYPEGSAFGAPFFAKDWRQVSLVFG